MKLKLLLVLIFLIPVWVYAQDIEVKKFEPLEKDQTAALSPRKDINGTVCGLVKVALKEAGAEFEGNVMGDVQFTGKEYLVYLLNGTKRLGIKHPNYLPVSIVFDDYSTQRITGGKTYQLELLTHPKNHERMEKRLLVRSFVKSKNDMSAITHKRLDNDGTLCALIKVRVVSEGVKFDGDIVGDVSGRLNEYKVYVAPRCKKLEVTCTNCEPTIVSFEDYGFYSLLSGCTYLLTLITK